MFWKKNAAAESSESTEQTDSGEPNTNTPDHADPDLSERNDIEPDPAKTSAASDAEFLELPSEATLAEERRQITEQQEQALLELEEMDAAVAAAEDELVAHLAKRGNIDVLEQACQSLQKLEELGASELFWGDGEVSRGQADLGHALDRVDHFYSHLNYLEDKHKAALSKIEGHREVVDVLEYDLYQAEQREESRRQEWIIERDPDRLPARRIAMPWMRGFEDDVRFRKTLAGATFASILLGLIVPLIDLPIPAREELIEVPERFAKLIRKPPVPPPAIAQPRIEPPPEEVKEEIERKEVTEPPPEPEVAVEAKPKTTREKVRSVGILAFRDNFSNLKQARPAARLGSAARVTDEGTAAQGRPERAMVTALGAGSSGGINLAAISRDIGGGDVELVAGVQLTQVESAIDGGGADDRPRAVGAIAGRTDEEIQIVFDKYKAGLYRLYNRELRKDPTLRGQIVLKLTIEPDGTVSLCGMETSDMDAPELAQLVVQKVRGFHFGEKDVPAITILYPIDFLPTA